MPLKTYLPLFISFLLLVTGLQAERIPVEKLIKDPSFDMLRLSPDGTRLAALAAWKEHLQLFVIDIKTKKLTQITGYEHVDVQNIAWRDNDTLSYGTKENNIPTRRRMLASADGKSIRDDDTPWNWYSTIFRDFKHPGHYVLQDYSVPEDALLIYDYDAEKQSKKLREKIPAAWTAHANPEGEILVAAGGIPQELARKKGPDAKFERFLYSREKVGAAWRKVFDWRYDETTFEVCGYAPDNRHVYVITDYKRNTSALVLFDFVEGKIVEELVADPVYDVESPWFTRDGRILLGTTIVRDYRETVWLHEGMKQLQEELNLSQPGHQHTFMSMSDDLSKHVILSWNDRDVGAYHLLDSKTFEMQTLVQRKPWLKPESMAVMQPISYKARDGLQIRGYLTLPPDVKPGKLPLVVFPHGGPWVRDLKEWNLDVQFLANRGYAVLQVNFRGSTGYGNKHLSLGIGEWGLSMQDDITDGVKWVVDQGIVDPSRIAIYGASYGGFAALAGLAKTPELYRCGISYVGVTDIDLFFKSAISWELEDPGINSKLIGDPRLDKAKFKEVSPLRLADRITAPVFLAYGERDPIVDFKHGTRMASALKRRGIPVEWMIRSQEGHGYRAPENLIQYYNKLEEFLAKHLAP